MKGPCCTPPLWALAGWGLAAPSMWALAGWGLAAPSKAVSYLLLVGVFLAYIPLVLVVVLGSIPAATDNFFFFLSDPGLFFGIPGRGIFLRRIFFFFFGRGGN